MAIQERSEEKGLGVVSGDADIRVEYNYYPMESSSNKNGGDYAEFYEFKDKSGPNALQLTVKGAQFITWRCRYPFALLFQSVNWSDYLGLTITAEPYLFQPNDGDEYAPIGLRSTRSGDPYYGQALTLSVILGKRREETPVTRVSYTFIPLNPVSADPCKRDIFSSAGRATVIITN